MHYRTGPLTHEGLSAALEAVAGAHALHFFDAAAPIVTAASIDMDKVFRASRYGKGADYLNCPMTREEYDAFYDALTGAELAPVHEFEKKLVFEGCLAVEILAARGQQTLAFGPLKPVGLIDPRTGKPPMPTCSCARRTSRLRFTTWSGFRRGSSGASKSGCFP